VEALHRALLPDERHHGLRRVQNWIGGSSWHPLSAEFVPPPPELVPGLMADLVDYVNGSVHAPLVQAGIVHAQFETIHPFTDGNGRVGRALIHTVLTRRGLTPSAVLPVSLVLATLRDRYVQGLTSYRYVGPPESDQAADGVAAWLDLFLHATTVAAEQASLFGTQISELQTDWEARLAEHRAARGRRETPRADSATSRILRTLPEVPIMTTRTAQRRLGVSFPAARAALEELADAGILTRRSVERGTTGYTATDVFSVVTHAERQLASTRWDTRISAPNRSVPAPPRP
jgi:Fic family protein